MTVIYKGFSTQTNAHKFRATNLDLIKQDLLNHFNIHTGEKLMMPDFGCGIWDYVFEPMTEETKAAIFEEVRKVIDYDPRVNATRVQIDGYEQGIQIQIDLQLVGGDQTSTMYVRFSRNNQVVESAST